MNVLHFTVISATLFGTVFTCGDRYGRAFCQGSRSYCDNIEMQQNCRETCGKCDETTPRPRPTHAPAQDVVQPADCFNLYGDSLCYTMRDKCETEEDVRTNCQKQCGTCGSASGSTSGRCFNNYGDTFCANSQHLCYKTGMKQNCRKQCGTCGMRIATARPPTRLTTTPSPAFDPVEEIRECPEDDLYPNLCANSDPAQCSLKMMQDACPITCGVCDPIRKK